MNEKFIKYIIIFSAISLLGLVFTQILWIKNVYKQSEELFDSRVSIATKETIDEFLLFQEKDSVYSCCTKPMHKNNFLINAKVLDSLLKIHFLNHKIDTNYQYDIVKCRNGETMFSDHNDLVEHLPHSCHKVGLSCLCKTESYDLEIVFPEKQKYLIWNLSFWLGISIIFILIIASSFAYVVFKFLKQKKISEIKNDFVNNMTHEFKTPISTISLASEVLLKSDKDTASSRIKKYSNIIFDEIQRLEKLVEKVLQIATLEKNEIELHLSEVDIHKLITETVTKLCFHQAEKNVSISYEFNAENQILKVDNIHIQNVIINLCENAYKYSGVNPEIKISTKNVQNSIEISIQDNGIGIKNEMQKQIFDKFYRIPTGNLHDVKGFGLGLYYVKNIVEAHNGKIWVESNLNNGSIFTIILPIAK